MHAALDAIVAALISAAIIVADDRYQLYRRMRASARAQLARGLPPWQPLTGPAWRPVLISPWHDPAAQRARALAIRAAYDVAEQPLRDQLQAAGWATAWPARF
jgi:hypothetical protein